MRRTRTVSLIALTAASLGVGALLTASLTRPVGAEPAGSRPRTIHVDTSGPVPSDAIVLFDGKDLSGFRTQGDGPIPWTIDDEGAMVAAKTGLLTKETFGDVQLHFDWSIPRGGNSGVKLHEWYEIQILDDHGRELSKGSTGSVYKQHAPLVNACRKAGEWQTYDIIFRAPRFDADGKLLRHGRFTVLQNGVLVQDNAKILGITNSNRKPTPEYERSILFTYHGAAVKFRNVWVRKLAPRRPDPE